jgi:phospholipase/lecithinase/hemolysin
MIPMDGRRRHLLRVGFTSTLIALSAQRADAGYSDLVIFSDSLSDIGNVYGSTLGLVPLSPPNYQGRFSNGPLWVEEMAQKQNLPAPIRSRNGGNDYAYGGVETGWGNTTYLFFQFPNLGTQINSYLSNHTPNASQLFTVWGGANDLNDGQTDMTVPVLNLANHINALAQAGAKNFLVPNLPPMGETPRYR